MAEVVSNSREDWAPRLKSCSKGMLCLVLVAALLFAAISIVAFSKYGTMGLVAAGVATLVCLVPVCSALFVTGLAVGTALFVDPATPVNIMAGLSEYLAQQGCCSINDIVGKLELPGDLATTPY